MVKADVKVLVLGISFICARLQISEGSGTEVMNRSEQDWQAVKNVNGELATLHAWAFGIFSNLCPLFSLGRSLGLSCGYLRDKDILIAGN